ncbi:DUF3617 domain-containing protein [Piscinibacter sakaiensis]|uniref:DUF3617 domain-containing protein n=1 Tax=Piscinibacter sakaiensis TaxID=1547922 RepID=UPI003AADF6E6
MKRFGMAALVACGLLVAGGASAQNMQLRPGLWEHRMTVKDGGQVAAAMAQMQQQLATMPADQRKMIEKMMADKGVGIGPSGNTVKVCMTKEDVERDSLPPQEGCTQNVKRSGNTWQVSFQCKGNPPSSGEGSVRMLSPTAYDGEFTLNTVVDGKPERMQMTQQGKWLAAECGAIKPRAR